MKNMNIFVVILFLMLLQSVNVNANGITIENQKMVLLDNSITVLQLENQVNSLVWIDLNLSNYVTNNTKFVYLRIRIKDTIGYPCLCSVRPKGSIFTSNPSATTHNPNELYHAFIWVKLGTDKNIQYHLYKPTNAKFEIRLYGYIEKNNLNIEINSTGEIIMNMENNPLGDSNNLNKLRDNAEFNAIEKAIIGLMGIIILIGFLYIVLKTNYTKEGNLAKMFVGLLITLSLITIIFSVL